VKGPEILDKFIDASEANMRQLFQNACTVSPCILFFDDFDELYKNSIP
jgi:peroxin-1